MIFHYTCILLQSQLTFIDNVGQSVFNGMPINNGTVNNLSEICDGGPSNSTAQDLVLCCYYGEFYLHVYSFQCSSYTCNNIILS